MLTHMLSSVVEVVLCLVSAFIYRPMCVCHLPLVSQYCLALSQCAGPNTGGRSCTCEREGWQRLGCLHLEGWMDDELDDQKDAFFILSLILIYMCLYTIREGSTYHKRSMITSSYLYFQLFIIDNWTR